uniref:Dynamin stalk domain-containing protein n=1 Tax=Tanacetum cinerariifolium TaxID=118510 RepID=A0A699L487_TANCI|nr:hypothetical protein [Tanacetum cinerariifolium]
MLNDFSKQLKSNHLNEYENFLADEIQLLEERKTLCREQVFSLLLQRKIDNIYVITDSFVSRVWDYIESVILNVLVSHAQNYPQLTQSVKKAAKNVIANTKECFKGKVFEFIKIKNMEGYTRDPRVISSLNKLKESHDRVFEAMRFDINQRAELLKVSVCVFHLKSYPKNIVSEAFDIKNMEGYTRDPRVISSLNKLKESHDRVFEAMRFDIDQRAELLKVSVRVFHLKSYPKNIVSEAFDIKVRMVAWLETVLHMFIGFVESHLLLMLRGMVENDMEAKLVNELRSDGENRYKPLPKESPLMTTKQWKLKNRIVLLEKFKKVVEETMDKISFHGY